MSNFACNCDCGNNYDCRTIAVVLSIIAGFVAAILTITATITVTNVFLWVAFGIAVGFLVVAFAISPFLRGHDRNGCICKNLSALLLGVLGTVVTSVVLLAVTFPATSVVGAIITGALIFFFALTLLVAACLIRCIASCQNNL